MKKLLSTATFLIISIAAFAQVTRLQEDFNLGTLPTGWTNSAVTGTQTWSFGINGSVTNAGNNNLNGTAMAFFDDDNLGSANTNSTVSLTSPVFDNSADSTCTLEFDYNFREFAGPLDRFYIEVYNGSSWVTVKSVTTNDCGNWLGACVGNFPHANIDISAHKNANCQIRFTYHDGNDWCWYVGFDNVLVSSTVNNDLAVTEIVNPYNSCSFDSTEQVTVIVKNKGSNNITAPFSLTIDVNNGIQSLIETVNSTLNVGDSIIYTFNGIIDLKAKGSYNLKIYSSLSLDSNNLNDTISRTIQSIIPQTLPYFDGFEGTVSNWRNYGQNNSWQIGVPASTNLNTAYQGNQSAVTNLSGNYNNLEVSYLESPCFYSAQPNRTPIVSFYINHLSEPSFDGLILEISSDNGITWQKVYAGSSSTNWYANNAMWAGNSGGWIKVENYLDSASFLLDFKLRFKMTSDGSGIREGFAIDDFNIRFINPVSLNENNKDHYITLSPNPNNGIFNLSVTNETVGKQYQIYDMKGAIVKEAIINSQLSQIELSEVKQGVYFIRIEGFSNAERIVVF